MIIKIKKCENIVQTQSNQYQIVLLLLMGGGVK